MAIPIRRIIAYVLVLLCCFHSETFAQNHGSILRVTVADAATGVFLRDAEIAVRHSDLKARTNFLGETTIGGLAKGVYTVEAQRDGYQPLSTLVKVSGRDSVRMTFLLIRSAQGLPTVTVKDTAPSPFLREFEERRHRGTGHYITEADIRAFHGGTLQALVIQKIPGIRIFGSTGGRLMVLSLRGANTTKNLATGSCQAAVYLNGVRVSDGDAGILSLNQVGGVEYYNPGSIPVQYMDAASVGATGNQGGSPACGVMLLWSP